MGNTRDTLWIVIYIYDSLSRTLSLISRGTTEVGKRDFSTTQTTKIRKVLIGSIGTIGVKYPSLLSLSPSLPCFPHASVFLSFRSYLSLLASYRQTRTNISLLECRCFVDQPGRELSADKEEKQSGGEEAMQKVCRHRQGHTKPDSVNSGPAKPHQLSPKGLFSLIRPRTVRGRKGCDGTLHGSRTLVESDDPTILHSFSGQSSCPEWNWSFSLFSLGNRHRHLHLNRHTNLGVEGRGGFEFLSESYLLDQLHEAKKTEAGNSLHL